VEDKTERWFHLCEQAADEQDPDKLLALVQEISDILEHKERRLLRQREDPKTGMPHTES
jgi:hypothetical protein